MQLILSNPYGWWGLLMLPLLVLIHSLHINRQPRIITTLFLVRNQASERRGGRTFVFWKHSVTFWLQVLAALLLTWLLLQPRWIGSQTSQRVLFVLDSSLSMDAFREATLSALQRESRSLADAAAHTHWLLTESRPRPQVLYSGTSREAMLRAAAHWSPSLGTHDWQAGLRAAHVLAGAETICIFITDHALSQPPQRAHVLGVGTPLPNVGFTGLYIDQREGETLWRTLVKNYSNEPAERQWWIEIDGAPLPPRTLRLPANGSLALAGPIPAEAAALTLVLEEDAFAADNRLPLVLPQPKRLSFSIDAAEQSAALTALLRSLPDTQPVAENAQPDLIVETFSHLPEAPLNGSTPKPQGTDPTASQVSANQPNAVETAAASVNTQSNAGEATAATAQPDKRTQELREGRALTAATVQPDNATARILFAKPQAERLLPPGAVSADAHPLNEGLNWNPLTLRGDVHPHALRNGEVPLVWLGSTPLIWLSEHNGSRDLVFNLSPHSSNILKLPATVLLISRFAEAVRQTKPRYEAANTELGETLRISLPAATREVRLNEETLPAATNPLIIQAPARPAHFTLSADGVPLLKAAAHFADVREADLRHAATFSDLAQVRSALIETNSEADSRFALWLLLLAAGLFASWYYAERGR